MAATKRASCDQHWLLRRTTSLPAENQKLILQRLLLCIVVEQLELDSNILIQEFCKQCLKHQDGIEHMCVISGPDDPLYDSIYNDQGSALIFSIDCCVT